jgi:CRP/FNR family transcriptional regulator, cyclic AMP receptor protein
MGEVEVARERLNFLSQHRGMNTDFKTQDALGQLAARITAHPFLKGLSSQHLNVLSDSAMLMEFKQGEIIFREGDIANRFYLIESGEVALETADKDAEPKCIQTIGAGDVLGWSWLFPPYYWHFDARAVKPTKAIFFYGTRLREKCEEDHDLGYELMKRMAGIVINRLQATRKQLLELRR